MQFISCTNTFWRVSLIADTAMATLVNRYSPSGIMPTNAATVASALSVKVLLSISNS